jgi:hypothetical protein
MVNLFVAIRLIQKEKLREIGKIETVPAVSARENLAEFMP